MANPINFGAFAPNPVEELASAVGGAVQQAPAQKAQLQQIGMQVLQPYAQKLIADPYNTTLLNQFNRIAKMYGLPNFSAGSQGGAYGSEGTSPGGSSGTPGAAAPGPGQSVPPTPATISAPGAAPSAQTPGAAPAKPGMNFGGSPSPNGASPQRWDDPRLQPRAQTYTALLQKAAANPSLLRDQTFHTQLIHAAAAVGRGPDEVKGDIAAYQQKVKAGIQPGGGHPATTPVGPTASPGASTAQPSPGAPAGATGSQTPAEQPQGGTAGNPAPGPGETQSYMRPSSEGPLRFDTNAWLGPLSSQDFASLSGMAPEERIAYLRQSGRDLNGFDQKWLHSEPSLSPAEQVTIAHDASQAIAGDIRDGATPDQIKLSVASYRPFLSPAQNAELDSNITSEMDGSLRIRQQQVASTGFLRQQTLNLMTRRLGDSEKKTAWDQDFRYTVLNDKNAQWSSNYGIKKQNAQTSYDRYSEELSRDQANGLVDDQGRPIKGGGGIKPGEMISTANKMLDSIRSGVNEYNQRLQTALQHEASGKGGGVNPPMEADIQNQIDAYNGLVDQMDARGMHYFNHYTGPDQAAIKTNTAAQIAGPAVATQGQTPHPALTPHPNIPKGAVGGTFSNGRHGYKLNGRTFYDDGTPGP